MNTPSIILVSALVLIPEHAAFAQAASSSARHVVTARAVVRRPPSAAQPQLPSDQPDGDSSSAAYTPMPDDTGDGFATAGCPFIASAP